MDGFESALPYGVECGPEARLSLNIPIVFPVENIT